MPHEMMIPALGGGAIPWYLVGGISLANCVGAYRAIGAADYAGSKVNLATPGTDNAGNGAAYPTWASGTGWTLNGTTQYLTTPITPPRNQTWSMFVRYSNPAWFVTDWECHIGSDAKAGYSMALGLRNYDGNMRVMWCNTTYGLGTTAAPLTGNYGMAGRVSYMDGVADLTAGAASNTGNHSALWIGALNWGGTPIQFVSGSILAVAVYNVTLTQTQITALVAAMAALTG